MEISTGEMLAQKIAEDLNDEEFMKFIESQERDIRGYLDTVKALGLGGEKLMDVDQEEAANIDEAIIKVDFLVDIEESHIESDKLIWIVALNGGVIVSAKLIREFRSHYSNDINRLVRDATRN